MATALKRSIRIIPVLVGGAHMPRESEVPPDLAHLTRLHAFGLTSGRFRSDAQLLINSLRGGRLASGNGEKRELPWSLITLLAAMQPLLFVLSGLMLHLQAETSQDFYSSAKLIFFGGLLVGATLAVLSWRSHNVPGVVQGLAQLILGAAVAVSLSAIGELYAINLAWSQYAVAGLLGVAAWWTIRNELLASRSDKSQGVRGEREQAGDVSESSQRQDHPPTRMSAPRTKAEDATRKSGRAKRVSSYALVSLNLFGLGLLVFAAVAMWVDRPRRASLNETFLFAVLTTGPWMLSLLLFGWIAEIRLCFMLGVATLVPFLALTIAGTIDGSWPLALAAFTGLASVAFAVETLRRLRKERIL